jgi:hypothetical protein
MSGEPYLPGYTVTWDTVGRQWEARSDTSDDVLYGKDQTALTLARCRLVMRLADELSALIRAAPEHGYSPPPRRPAEP